MQGEGESVMLAFGAFESTAGGATGAWTAIAAFASEVAAGLSIAVHTIALGLEPRFVRIFWACIGFWFGLLIHD